MTSYDMTEDQFAKLKQLLYDYYMFTDSTKVEDAILDFEAFVDRDIRLLRKPKGCA